MTLDDLIEREQRQIEFSERYIKTKKAKIDYFEELKKKDGWHLVNLQRGKEGDMYAERLFFLVKNEFKLPDNFNAALATLFDMKIGEDYLNLNMTNDVQSED